MNTIEHKKADVAWRKLPTKVLFTKAVVNTDDTAEDYGSLNEALEQCLNVT